MAGGARSAQYPSWGELLAIEPFRSRVSVRTRRVININLNREEHDQEVRREHDQRRRKHLNAQERARYQKKRDTILTRIRARRERDKSYLETNRRYYVRNRSRILKRRRQRAQKAA